MSKPPKLSFAELTEDLLPTVLELEKLCNPAPWSERSFRTELGHAFGIFLVVHLDGEAVGYGGIWLVIDEAHVTTLSVSPDHRRKGIARALLAELLRRAAARGAICSTLEVRAGNQPAIALYETMGYRTLSRRRRYYPDNQEDALVMWLDEMP